MIVFYYVLSIFSVNRTDYSFESQKSITVSNTVQKLSGESNGKPNKIWVDKDGQFHKTLMKFGIPIKK